LFAAQLGRRLRICALEITGQSDKTDRQAKRFAIALVRDGFIVRNQRTSVGHFIDRRRFQLTLG
jgi:hypothetical protein